MNCYWQSQCLGPFGNTKGWWLSPPSSHSWVSFWPQIYMVGDEETIVKYKLLHFWYFPFWKTSYFWKRRESSCLLSLVKPNAQLVLWYDPKSGLTEHFSSGCSYGQSLGIAIQPCHLQSSCSRDNQSNYEKKKVKKKENLSVLSKLWILHWAMFIVI